MSDRKMLGWETSRAAPSSSRVVYRTSALSIHTPGFTSRQPSWRNNRTINRRRGVTHNKGGGVFIMARRPQPSTEVESYA